jgi:hypothetical protein
MMSADSVDAHVQLQPPGQTVGALRLVVFGGLLCIFDVTYSSISRHRGTYDGWRFDFLSDTVGVAMILAGLYRLMKLKVPGNYKSRLTFVSVVAWCSLAATIVKHRVFESPEAWSIALHVLSLVRLAAIVVFCSAMVQLGSHWRLPRAQASFQRTRLLFLLLYVAPLTVVELWIWTDGFGSGSELKVETGWAFVLVAILAIPLVHLFVSTSRLRGELEAQLALAGA